MFGLVDLVVSVTVVDRFRPAMTLFSCNLGEATVNECFCADQRIQQERQKQQEVSARRFCSFHPDRCLCPPQRRAKNFPQNHRKK